jgi:ABC-type amino acid transport system permease subunit
VDLPTAGHIVASREFVEFEVLAFAAMAYLATRILVPWCANVLWRHLRYRTGALIAY